MIGIVVVSHSRPLARAAVALAAEMVQGSDAPAIAIAAGLDDDTLGTDAQAVSAAIHGVASPDGVLVLLDLGSAVLSAELALELLDPPPAGPVRLSAAPLVEGLVAAVVAAAGGASLESVATEAERGLAAKQASLGASTPRAATDTDAEPAPQVDVAAHGDDEAAEAHSVKLRVTNSHGLHARPAARVVALARSFDARVTLTNLDTGRGPADATSLSQVAVLDARSGHRLRASATGPDAAAVLAALRDLADRGFGDEAAGGDATPVDDAPPDEAPRPDGGGLDIAIGPAMRPASPLDLESYDAGEPGVELRRSRDAVAAVTASLVELRRRTAAEVGEDQAAIFDAHLALLDDPAVVRQVEAAVADGASAPRAWTRILSELADSFEGLGDAYLRGRAADVRAVLDACLRALLGEQEPALAGAGVLVVPELDPATAVSLDATAVAGVVTVRGGDTGHGVLVARSRGIPVLTDAGAALQGVTTGTPIAFDAATRVLVIDPDEEQLAGFRSRLEDSRRSRVQALERATEPATTLDGVTVPVLANVASVAEARLARASGADGAGLVRTEVLFAGSRTPPSAREQYDAFRSIAEALDGRPVTIRTWDVGGDKPLPFLPLDSEANPFLGQRGLRVFRSRPELLVEQLVAVCRLAAHAPVHLMFPMVTTREEVLWARERLEEAAARTGGLPSSLRVGIMVEVPAAALLVDLLGEGLHFVSIGTNDLTQYTTAADRSNGAVAELSDAFSPAVLTLVDTVSRRRPGGLRVAVCGDLASSPLGAALLVGLGVDELSAAPVRVPEIKSLLRRSTVADLRALARQALRSDSGPAVRRLLQGALGGSRVPPQPSSR